MDFNNATEIIRESLKEVAGTGNLKTFREIDSTNIYLKEKILCGQAKTGDIAIAEKQTAGIGRHGRRFFSPGGSGLYFSMVLSPGTETELITAAAGVSVCEAVNKVFNVKTEIKWVNDIYLNDKKICGILAQRFSDVPEYVILGCGINVSPPENGFPKEISDSAGYITEKCSDNDYAALAVNIVRNILRYLSGKEDFIKKYSSLQYLKGKKVTIINYNGEKPDGKEYTVLSTDEKCRLVISGPDGNIYRLDSGEVGVIPKT